MNWDRTSSGSRRRRGGSRSCLSVQGPTLNINENLVTSVNSVDSSFSGIDLLESTWDLLPIDIGVIVVVGEIDVFSGVDTIKVTFGDTDVL